MPLKDREARNAYARELYKKNPRPKKPRKPSLREVLGEEAFKERRRAYHRERSKHNLDKRREYMKKYMENGGRGKMNEWRKNLRKQVVALYGGMCACCSESTYEFLAIDHIDGGGTKHIRSFSGQNAYYRWLLNDNIGPRPGFRVLCHNCNQARAHHGTCPHGNGI